MSRRRFAKLLESLTPEVKRQLETEMYAAGQIIQVEAQISITTGAVSGKHHQPSPAGSPPNADTHYLADNIVTLHVEPLNVLIISYAAYSAALEYGTSKMPARPFMQPAAIHTREKVNRKLGAAARRAVRSHFAKARSR